MRGLKPPPQQVSASLPHRLGGTQDLLPRFDRARSCDHSRPCAPNVNIADVDDRVTVPVTSHLVVGLVLVRFLRTRAQPWTQGSARPLDEEAVPLVDDGAASATSVPLCDVPLWDRACSVSDGGSPRRSR